MQTTNNVNTLDDKDQDLYPRLSGVNIKVILLKSSNAFPMMFLERYKELTGEECVYCYNSANTTKIDPILIRIIEDYDDEISKETGLNRLDTARNLFGIKIETFDKSYDEYDLWDVIRDYNRYPSRGEDLIINKNALIKIQKRQDELELEYQSKLEKHIPDESWVKEDVMIHIVSFFNELLFENPEVIAKIFSNPQDVPIQTKQSNESNGLITSRYEQSYPKFSGEKVEIVISKEGSVGFSPKLCEKYKELSGKEISHDEPWGREKIRKDPYFLQAIDLVKPISKFEYGHYEKVEIDKEYDDNELWHIEHHASGYDSETEILVVNKDALISIQKEQDKHIPNAEWCKEDLMPSIIDFFHELLFINPDAISKIFTKTPVSLKRTFGPVSLSRKSKKLNL